MIEKLTKKPLYGELLTFLKNNFNYDFYITENNIRFYITDEINLRKFLKQSIIIYVDKHDGDYHGLISVNKSLGEEKRYYIKLIAENFNVAQNLLTVLLWNFEKDLFIKLRKDSSFVSVFKNKGFRFKGGRGIQMLLHRKYIPKKETISIKHELDTKE